MGDAFICRHYLDQKALLKRILAFDSKKIIQVLSARDKLFSFQTKSRWRCDYKAVKTRKVYNAMDKQDVLRETR